MTTSAMVAPSHALKPAWNRLSDSCALNAVSSIHWNRNSANRHGSAVCCTASVLGLQFNFADLSNLWLQLFLHTVPTPHESALSALCSKLLPHSVNHPATPLETLLTDHCTSLRKPPYLPLTCRLQAAGGRRHPAGAPPHPRSRMCAAGARSRRQRHR